jgi:hypothetical protein
MVAPINLAVEDELSEFVLRRVLKNFPTLQIKSVFRKGGYGYLKNRVLGFNQAANYTPFLLLTDLDRAECPPIMINDWLKGNVCNPRFLFRIAVPEVESWLLADNIGFRRFLGLRGAPHNTNPEEIADAKAELLTLAEKSRIKEIREAIVYRDENGQRYQGPDYNGTLGYFVKYNWDIRVASNRSPSLIKLIKALNQLKKDLKPKKQ